MIKVTISTSPCGESRDLVNVPVEERVVLGVSNVEHLSRRRHVARHALVAREADLKAILESKNKTINPHYLAKRKPQTISFPP